MALVLSSGPVAAEPLRIDFSRADQGGVAPLQPGWSGFGLPATGGDEIAIAFPSDELAGTGEAVTVTLAGNSHARDYAPATGPHADLSALLSDGPLLNLPGVITLSFSGLRDGTYELTSYHHTTQFGVSERPPATPFDVRLTDADDANVVVADGLTVSDNSSAETTTVTVRFTARGGGDVHVDFMRGPDAGGTADHFSLPGFVLAAVGPPPRPVVLGRVVLNECLADNEDTLVDGDGVASDWIEIWNSTEGPVDLGGWHLTDDPAEPAKWPFPEITLEPDGFLLVFASGRTGAGHVDGAGFHHANFRLAREAGGFLALTGPGGEIVDAYESYPAQREDVSYGLVAGDAAEEEVVGYLARPTPGAPNTAEGFAGFVADTTFSHDRGFFTEPFHVVVATATEGATIRCTIDGSKPTESQGFDYPGGPGIPITTTTALRAAAFKPGLVPTNVDTQTYVFPADVPDQPDMPAGFPTTWSGWDYGMDQDPASLGQIVDDPDADPEKARAVIAEALLALPTMSIVMNVDDLFGPEAGIYHHTHGRGAAWEREASVEIIHPGGGTGEDAQVDCGIRLQGFTSRDPNRNPKHSLRLVFRKQYGTGKWRYPLFGPGAANEFDTLVLRSNSQDAWVYDSAGNRAGQFVRDEWNRRTQLAMGRPSPHGTWVHLYLNGLYWGVYNPAERPDASFMASYFGGDKAEYDSLKNHEEIIDGNGTAYRNLLALVQNNPDNFAAGYRDFSADAEYQALQGNDPDGTRNPALPVHLDVPNLIDYMIHNMYSAATDWPGNNYIGRNRTAASTGFKFLDWDNEHGMKPGVTENRTTPHSRDADSPTKFHHPLRANAEYRMLFADHLHRAFFNGGPLFVDPDHPEWDPEHPERNRPAALWMELTGAIEQALVAESARWGDYRRSTPYTVTDDFRPLRASLLRNWFPRRSAIVLGQFRSQGLYPDLEAPAFSRHGGTVPAGFALTMEAPDLVHFTTDGSDPRLPGGAVAPGASTYRPSTATMPVPLVGSDAAVAGATFHVLVPTDGALGDAWTLSGFDAAGWTDATADGPGAGYERFGAGDYGPAIDHDLSGSMMDRNPGVFLRHAFLVENAASITGLQLRMRFDDGYAATLNGTPIDARNAPDNPAWDSAATASHEASLEGFDVVVSVDPALLVNGSNVLAIHGLNDSVGSSDFLIVPELEGTAHVDESPDRLELRASTLVRARTFRDGEWSALNEAFFALPDLVISEVMFHPEPDGDAEFIEILNTGSEPVSLAGLRLAGGIAFDFSSGTVAKVAPGGRILVVRDRAAFAAAHGNGFDALITGVFDGALGNDGDTVRLEGPGGVVLHAFEYDDAPPWPEDADGARGRSLVLVAPDSFPDHADPRNWRPSAAPGGNPGTSDAILLAEDVDLLEYALGGAAPRITFSPTGGLLLHVSRVLGSDDVTLRFEQSDGLDSWDRLDPRDFVVERFVEGPIEVTTFALDAGAPGSIRRFLRVVVIRR